MGRLLERCGLYMGYWKDSRSSTKNFTAHATLQGKLKILVDAKVLLCFAFFRDVLAEAKKFSLVTQEKKSAL